MMTTHVDFIAFLIVQYEVRYSPTLVHAARLHVTQLIPLQPRLHNYMKEETSF